MKCVLLKCKTSKYDGIQENKIYVAVKKDDDCILKISECIDYELSKEESQYWTMVDSFRCDTEEKLHDIMKQVNKLKINSVALVFNDTVLEFEPMEINPDAFSIPKDKVKPVKPNPPTFNVYYDKWFLKK